MSHSNTRPQSMPRTKQDRELSILSFKSPLRAKKTRAFAEWVIPWLEEQRPVTVRGIFYAAVVLSWFKNDLTNYNKCVGRLINLRKFGDIPYDWIVDMGRSRDQIPCWRDLRDYAEDCRYGYTLDFWAHLPHYVCFLVEKAALASILGRQTRELRLPLFTSHGNISLSFCHEIGTEWREVDRPIYCYYVGDFDPSGLMIEESYQKEIAVHSGKEARVFEDGDEPLVTSPGEVIWTRLALTRSDLDRQDVLHVPIKEGSGGKRGDSRSPGYKRKWGISYGSEAEALSPQELRGRIREAAARHFTAKKWSLLERQEKKDRKFWADKMSELWSDSTR